MKVENIAFPGASVSKIENLPIINVEEIKSILYLGMRGEITFESDKKHAIDTYA